MTGRGSDQILPHPCPSELHEPYVKSALEYVWMAEANHGRIPKPVSYSYVWGDALEEIGRFAPSVRIINLETSITTSENFESKSIHYRMHPQNTPCLTAARVDCCVLANNHVLDWGWSGLSDTLAALRQAGIKAAGAGSSSAEAWKPATILRENFRILIFAAGTLDSGIAPHWAAAGPAPGIAVLPDLSEKTAEGLAEQVKNAKRPGDLTVLSIHWGGNWGYSIPRDHQAFAHALIDSAQIDLIHGHSSHHPKGIEVYRNKLILYGCGDFFNDYEGISGFEEYRSRLVLAYFVTVASGTGMLLRLEMAPFEIKRFRLQRAGVQDSVWLRDLMRREGSSLGTKATLDARSHLVLSWWALDRKRGQTVIPGLVKQSWRETFD
jgi:poly-gamma-glutamate capsule biosynthesis protein CapA/YwtB (metallophosphatase superfamily)